MKTFQEFIQEADISYKAAIPHTVYEKGKPRKLPKGKAMAMRSHSSAGGGSDGSGGDGGD
jgi:hypothetical protein